MSYQQIPTRTTSDTNSNDDINQLQDNFDSFLNSNGSAIEFNFADTTSTTGLHTESGVLKFKGDTVSTGAGGTGVNQINFDIEGDVYVATKIKQIVFATAMTFNDWYMRSDDAPDATLSADINKNGVSIFGAGTTIDILAGATVATLAQTVSFAKGDVCSFDIDSIGSNTAGGNFLNIAGV